MRNVHVYKDTLLNLASEDKFRDQMVGFSLGDVDKDHRENLVPVITRILYGKLLKRKVKSSKDKFSIANRRAVVLAFFSALNPSELSHFFGIMFRAFPGYDITRAAAETPSDVSEAMESLDIRSVSHTRQLGFLNLVSDVTKQLGSLATRYLPHLLTVICSILEYSVGKAKASEDGVGPLRTLCLHRAAELFEQFPSFDYSPWEALLVNARIPLRVASQLHDQRFRAVSASQMYTQYFCTCHCIRS